LRKFYVLIISLLSWTICFSQAPSANFTAGQTAGCAPVVVSFQDLSSGNPTSWQWNFGNGNTSTLQNPSTTYFSPGTYTVTLTAANASGTNTLTRTAYITVFAKPSVNFTADDSTGCAPFAVRFTDLSTAAPGTTNTSWQWDFGNGTGASVQNPQTSFTSPGNYTVSLRVTSDKGCFATLSKTAYVQITGGLQLDFSSSLPTRCQAPFPINFTNNSSGPGALTYFWNFGDGGTSTQQSPSHTYAATGNYPVMLAVTSSNGCTDTLRRTNAVAIQNITTSFSAPDSICVQLPASFTNTSSPAPQSSSWDFGDATNSNAASPQKIFTTPGTYTVRLVQAYAYCTDSASKTIRVLPKPAAAFTANNTASCQPPLTVNFSNQTTGAVSYFWSFGDGTTSTQQNPTHTYTAYGNYTVTLVATNTSGCSDTLTQAGFVRIQRPVISFPTLPQMGCVPYTTTFSAGISTLDNITSYLWNFGDGNTSTLATPTHTYPVQGTYTVSLTITTSTGCMESLSLTSAVNTGRIPVIDFTASPNPVCAFGPVNFTSIVSEGDTWLWSFGAGSPSNHPSPVHQYTDTGSFNVSLTVTNNGCPTTLTKPQFVSVKPPISDFTYRNDCETRRQFFFTDRSVGATSYRWDFGDGSTSTQQNPTHSYAAFGSYVVTLTAINDTCSHSRSYTVNVFDETPTFVADLGTACKTAAINFTTSSTNLGNITAYAWDFGNGTTSSAQNPQAVYGSAGNFTVTLITTDSYGCRDTASHSNYIRINGPTALFTVPNNQGCKGFRATFANQSYDDGINPLALYRWEFGDGASYTSFNAGPPQHVYPNAGTYTPKLIVTDALGCKDSLSLGGMIVATSPEANFVTADTLTCLGSTVNFTNTTTPQNYTSTWEFGDGAMSTQQNPSHVYADTGTYNVRLRIVDGVGCADTLTIFHYVRIEETNASFSVSDSLGGCTPFEVRFTNTSDFYSSSAWDLGNGNSTAQHPVQVYNTPGSYTIQLVATGRGGCTDTATRTIQIFDASATTFSYTPFTGCTPLPLTATVNSPADLDFTWDFGDGTILTTTAANTVHTYQVFGNYVPKLLLTDSGNCLIPLIGADTVRIVGANAKFGWDKTVFCDSGTVAFTDSSTFNDPVTSYSWNFGDGGTSSASSPSHTYTTPGNYPVSLIVQTQQACVDTFRIDSLIKVVESPSISVQSDTVICQNDFVTYVGFFNRPDTSTVRWSWQFPNGASSALQQPAVQQFTAAGNFLVQTIATNSTGCADTVSRRLLVHPLPAVTIPSPQVAPLATPVQLPASYTNNIASYAWSPAAGLTCTDCPQPVASPKFNTLYTVNVVDDNGCRNAGKVQVIVFCPGANVFVPNTFSPNGDGSNDVFYVRGRGLNRVKSLRIYNRWGELVFEKINFAVNDASAGWDGSYRGKRLSADVYVYQVDVYCDNSESIRFDGSISLIN
jgi:gliding motility-associated-like protein